MKSYIDKLLIILVLFCISGCGEEDFPVPQASTVDADFEFTVSNNGFAPATLDFNNLTRVAEGETASYSWSFGDGSNSTAASPSHLFEEPGTYTIKLSATTSNDLDNVEQTITIKDPNALLVTLFLIDAAEFSINEVNGPSFGIDGFGTGIEYDPENELIYWTNADNGTLNKANLDGSNAEVVSASFTDPRDIALDLEKGMAYVTDRGVNAVYQVNLSDGNASILYDEASDGLGSLPVGIDLYNGDLYITCVDIGAEAVWKGPINGNGVVRIIDYSAGGYGYGIAVDQENEKIYFDDTDGGQILMANLDGSGISSIASTGNRVYGIVVDNVNDKIYWTERNSGSVFMADLDGSNVVTLSSDFTDPRGLFFIP